MRLSDERYKQLMTQAGMPNSVSLSKALQQVAHEVEVQVRSENAVNIKLRAALELAWQYIGCPPLIRPDYEEVVNEIQDALDEAHKLKLKEG